MATSAGLAVLGLLALALGATFQPGVAPLALLILGMLSLAAALVGGLWTYGYFTLRYRMTPEALALRWLDGDEVVPMSAVAGIYAGQRLERVRGVRGLTWPGYVVGVAREDGVAVRYYSSSRRPEDLLLLLTDAAVYVISPQDVPAFRRELIRRIELDERATASSPSGPLRRAAEALLDPTNVGLLAAGLVLALAVAARYMLGFGAAPAEVPLRTAADGASSLAPRRRLAQLPILALACWSVSALTGLALFGWSPSAGRLLWLGAAGAIFVILVAAIRLIP